MHGSEKLWLSRALGCGARPLPARCWGTVAVGPPPSALTWTDPLLRVVKPELATLEPISAQRPAGSAESPPRHRTGARWVVVVVGGGWAGGGCGDSIVLHELGEHEGCRLELLQDGVPARAREMVELQWKARAARPPARAWAGISWRVSGPFRSSARCSLALSFPWLLYPLACEHARESCETGSA